METNYTEIQPSMYFLNVCYMCLIFSTLNNKI